MTAPAPATAGTPESLKVRVEAGEDAGSRNVATLLVSDLSSHPGLVLLEGLRTDVLDREVVLSESGLVASGTTVADRRLRPDVILVVASGPGATGPQWKGRVLVKVGRKERAVEAPVDFALLGGAVTELAKSVLSEMAELVDAPGRKALARSCRSKTLSWETVAQKSCVQELVVHCNRLTGDGWQRTLCLARSAEELAAEGKTMRKRPDLYAGVSSAQMEALARASRARRGTVDAATTRLVEKATEIMTAHTDGWKDALAAFKKEARDRLDELVKSHAPEPVVGAVGDEMIKVKSVRIAGVRWGKSAGRAQIELDIDFIAKLKTLPSGAKRRLSSFLMTGGGGSGASPLKYRLLAGREHKLGGTIRTALPFHKFAAVDKFNFGESMDGML